MNRILCLNGRPIAVIELLPNNPLGASTQEVEGELGYLLSPDEGDADIVDVTDEELAALRRGETVLAVAQSSDEQEEDEDEE